MGYYFMNMNDNWVIVWKNLGIKEEYTDQLEFELFYLDPLVEQLRVDKFNNRGRLKELYFLIDASSDRRYEWLRKATITGVHHNIPGYPENDLASFLILCKKQMKKDCENGVILW